MNTEQLIVVPNVGRHTDLLKSQLEIPQWLLRKVRYKSKKTQKCLLYGFILGVEVVGMGLSHITHLNLYTDLKLLVLSGHGSRFGLCGS